MDFYRLQKLGFKPMRILQIIDSLEAGGAERMAVNYANALVGKIEFSGLVATRKQGAFLSQIDSNVSYLFLNKKSQLDFGALFRLRFFVLKNNVTHVHAHSTSFFFAFLLKILSPSLKIIRHDHYGNNESLAIRPSFVLKLTAPFFNGVVAVNQKLKSWSEVVLKSNNVVYLPNFPVKVTQVIHNTKLKGNLGTRIVSLANLREQKNHFLLLEVARKLKYSHPDWSFHLVGKDFEDAYSTQIKALIMEWQLENQVFLYGSRTDVSAILQQSTIGILTSVSEGLPVAVLEYGLSQLPIVVTAVGELPNMIENKVNGCIVPTNHAVEFHAALIELIQKESLRDQLAKALHQTITAEYSEPIVIEKYINWVQTL